MSFPMLCRCRNEGFFGPRSFCGGLLGGSREVSRGQAVLGRYAREASFMDIHLGWFTVAAFAAVFARHVWDFRFRVLGVVRIEFGMLYFCTDR